MRIGELARLTDTGVDTVRYYERLGLRPAPVRTSANYRSYGEPQVQRLDFIRRCGALDMSFAEVRTLPEFCDHPEREYGEVNAVLDERIQAVQRGLEELVALQRHLQALRRVCRAPTRASHCRILRVLRSSRLNAVPTARGSVPKPVAPGRTRR